MNTVTGTITAITKRPLLGNVDTDDIMTAGEGSVMIPKKCPVKEGKNLMVCILYIFFMHKCKELPIWNITVLYRVSFHLFNLRNISLKMASESLLWYRAAQ